MAEEEKLRKKLVVTMSYRWWRWDNGVIPDADIPHLSETAETEICRNRLRGECAGNLHATTTMSEVYGPIEYAGWWEVKEED